MTTDITELAQSLKAAAENAIGAHERLAAYPYGEIIDISQHEGEQIDIDITDLNEFNKEANPVNILALVEAMEKAQQRIDELLPSNRNMLMPALGGLSRDHLVVTIQTVVDNYSALHTKWLEDRQRIAELESRTVKLPDFRHEHFNSNWGEHDAEAYQVAPREALTADGIKWEAE
ncbi:ead/Ea22-like family protein [Klebsiella grimontii]|uniref:ead/Ea22-like family protein n=1 Tax=Klebsiella grimontii TaxID=2058152 RepID=UPI0021614679|nr:ead/Ea22-like family protein [Klebsiella grimontii]MCS0528201.1 ead/Ea22-like family protein [Klebsiella grimontii]